MSVIYVPRVFGGVVILTVTSQAPPQPGIAALSDGLRGQATMSDVEIAQATANDRELDTVTLSDQG